MLAEKKQNILSSQSHGCPWKCSELARTSKTSRMSFFAFDVTFGVKIKQPMSC